ncbi:hypothetical protein ABLN72_07910, partial [Mycobacterium tuberculosis]
CRSVPRGCFNLQASQHFHCFLYRGLLSRFRAPAPPATGPSPLLPLAVPPQISGHDAKCMAALRTCRFTLCPS